MKSVHQIPQVCNNEFQHLDMEFVTQDALNAIRFVEIDP